MQNSNIIWRIDDRLIHGQIIIGWCGQLPIDLLIVCDDEIASNEWERNLLLIAAPPNFTMEVLGIDDTSTQSKKWESQYKKVLVLLKSPKILKDLISTGLEIKKVNVGGIHFQNDRKEYLSYLFLSEEEIEIFRDLINKGIYFECQDLPTSNAYDLMKIIEKKAQWKL